MKVSFNWLKEFVDIPWEAKELAYRLEMTGTAVESITEIKPGHTMVVTGKILDIQPHPQADKLVVTEVDAGGKPLRIVCGAKNISVGDIVPVALVGAVLPGGMEIKKAALRGVESEGMLCSETELELGEDARGIMILDADTPVGKDLAEALELADAVIEFEITPNRPDCMSMIGVAREVAALTGGDLRMPEVKINEGQTGADFLAKIEIKDSDLCPRYAARVINNLKVGQSPYWMRSRLAKGGVRPINNLVDITNYILLETGQPLHAFDRQLLKDHTIIVRRAAKNETMETLDGVVRTLGPDMLVIADPAGPVALAGIMGGSTTEINDNTTQCLLESAYFSATGVFRTSFALDLRSEASARFERGADYDGTVYAADRAAYLMQELAGGIVARGVIDVYPNPIKPINVELDTGSARGLIGADIPDDDMVKYLTSLDIKVSLSGGRLTAEAPSFRPDITRGVDLVEEIARVYGFDNVPSAVPHSRGSAADMTVEQLTLRVAERTLAAAGLTEAVNYAFVDPDDIAGLLLPAEDTRMKYVKLANPVSEAQSVLRTTLLPGLLRVAGFNAGYGESDVQIFETGRAFFDLDDDGLPLEKTFVSGVLIGKWGHDAWCGKGRAVDFYDVKGIAECLLGRLGVLDASVTGTEDPLCHPGQSARLNVNGVEAGSFGLLHPMIAKGFDLDSDVFVFEFDLGILSAAYERDQRVKTPSRFPAMTRDISMLVNKDREVGAITDIIKEAAGDLLSDAYPFDLYEGDQVPEGKKSLAYRLVYRLDDRTLTIDETEAAHANVISALQDKLKAEIR